VSNVRDEVSRRASNDHHDHRSHDEWDVRRRRLPTTRRDPGRRCTGSQHGHRAVRLHPDPAAHAQPSGVVGPVRVDPRHCQLQRLLARCARRDPRSSSDPIVLGPSGRPCCGGYRSRPDELHREPRGVVRASVRRRRSKRPRVRHRRELNAQSTASALPTPRRMGLRRCRGGHRTLGSHGAHCPRLVDMAGCLVGDSEKFWMSGRSAASIRRGTVRSPRAWRQLERQRSRGSRAGDGHDFADDKRRCADSIGEERNTWALQVAEHGAAAGRRHQDRLK
jgi:hypothetical protein